MSSEKSTRTLERFKNFLVVLAFGLATILFISISLSFAVLDRWIWIKYLFGV